MATPKTETEVVKLFESIVEANGSDRKAGIVALMAVYREGWLDAKPVTREDDRRRRDESAHRKRRQQLRAMADKYADELSRMRSVLPCLIFSKKRLTAPVFRARQELMWILRRVERLSYNEIATAIRRNDHTTVITGIRAVERRIESSPELRDELTACARAASSEAPTPVGRIAA